MNNLWNRLSARERRLALGAVALLGAFLVYAAVLPAINHLNDLDLRISELEDEVCNNTQLAALSKVISARYGELAVQHSTAWTQAEISDGLQRELDRLSLKTPPPPDGSARGGGPRLLTIAYRPEGALTPYTGYREYQTTFSTQSTTIAAVAEFLRRLQDSPQTLRVDKLTVRRDNPASNAVLATITITRTVVDRSGVEEDLEADTGKLARNGGFEAWDAVSKGFLNWRTDGCAASIDETHVVEGTKALKLVAEKPRARYRQDLKLAGGRKYRLSLHAVATGPASFVVYDVAAKKVLPGEQTIATQGEMRAYTLEFQTPGEDGKKVELMAPLIILNGVGTTAFVDGVVLEEVTE